MLYSNDETTICRICLEPVTNFICTDCLFDGIQRWVAEKSSRPDVTRVAIAGRNSSIKKMLSEGNNRSFCVSCKNQVDEIACPCCYLYEMHAAIKSAEPGIAQRFETDFNFDFMFHHGMSQLNLWESIHGRLLSSKSFRPIVITEKKEITDSSECERCEAESDNLVEAGGEWICESCRDEEGSG